MKTINDFKAPRYNFLSNFYPSKFEYDGEMWNTVEHAFQASKTVVDKEQDQIRLASTPGWAKLFGKRATLRYDWDEIKIPTMRELVFQKFNQNSVIKQQLLDTGDAYLVEENKWGDTYWGQTSGKGQNWLGQILMETRSFLRRKT